jgi:hypothetical protein
VPRARDHHRHERTRVPRARHPERQRSIDRRDAPGQAPFVPHLLRHPPLAGGLPVRPPGGHVLPQRRRAGSGRCGRATSAATCWPRQSRGPTSSGFAPAAGHVRDEGGRHGRRCPAALDQGAAGVIVSNHGGRSSIRATRPRGHCPKSYVPSRVAPRSWWTRHPSRQRHRQGPGDGRQGGPHRPRYAYGFAAAGEAGVTTAIEILRAISSGRSPCSAANPQASSTRRTSRCRGSGEGPEVTGRSTSQQCGCGVQGAGCQSQCQGAGCRTASRGKRKRNRSGRTERARKRSGREAQREAGSVTIANSGTTSRRRHRRGARLTCRNRTEASWQGVLAGRSGIGRSRCSMPRAIRLV